MFPTSLDDQGVESTQEKWEVFRGRFRLERQRNGEEREVSVGFAIRNRHKDRRDVCGHRHTHCVKRFHSMSNLSSHYGLCLCPVRACLECPITKTLCLLAESSNILYLNPEEPADT